MGPRWKGNSSEAKSRSKAKALAQPMSKIVLQLQSSLTGSSSRGFLCGSSVLVEMKAEEANLLESACFGVRVMENKHWFQLSMEEAFYLCHSLKCLEIVEDKCSKNDNQLWKCMESRRASFPYLYKAYSHLRMKNWVVRSGVKYGVDFVAYRHHPALVHSEYAVIVLSEEHSYGNKRLTEWLDIHCTTRLCGGVAKTLLVLYISRNGHSVDSPSCLERCTVEERTVTRWKPEQCRDDDRLVESENETKLKQLGANIFSCCTHSTGSEPLDIDDSEHILNDDELSLNTMAEDGRDEEVAEKLTIMHEECLDEEYTNDYDEEEEEEENHYASRATSKMQPRRSSVSKAYWDDEMGMAVVFPKGRIWRTMGISRNGKLYISIEEVLYLVEIGALLLLDGSDTSISLEDIYTKVSDGKNEFLLEEFRAYRQLRYLGYIVARHGIPWSRKGVKTNCESVSSQVCPEAEEIRSLNGLFNGIQINEVRAVFDIYLPNSKFKKSSPGDPNFVLCFTRGHPPSKPDLEALERQFGSTALKFCHVEEDCVSFYSFDKVELHVVSCHLQKFRHPSLN
ncbi:uncharacterized protein LOC133739875 isoform X2 [Rosa rugosa]|uniref:uncharacterized protein LOC133739875 isoform X2 n=1 Tax=Rosa rugosa TaxID=74645 RepID=UPI002B413961|nr:uncharacterized protein LOC133739875 isoform X2 [Rosa rugosa]